MSRRRSDPESRSDESGRAERLKEAVEREHENIERGISVLVYKFCCPLRPGELRDRVEDIRQETVRQALASASTYDPSRPAVAWLLGIATNLIKGQRRETARRRRPVPFSDVSTEDWLQALEGHTTGSQDDSEGLRLDVRHILDRLEPGYRRALELRYIQGLSGADLARALGVSPGAARVRLTRSLQAFRALWGPSDIEVTP